MRSFYDDNDEFDELSFDDFAATRRIIKDKHRSGAKSGSRKKSHKAHKEHKDHWDASDWDEFDDYDDYRDDEFDRHYRYEE